MKNCGFAVHPQQMKLHQERTSRMYYRRATLERPHEHRQNTTLSLKMHNCTQRASQWTKHLQDTVHQAHVSLFVLLVGYLVAVKWMLNTIACPHTHKLQVYTAQIIASLCVLGELRMGQIEKCVNPRLTQTKTNLTTLLPAEVTGLLAWLWVPKEALPVTRQWLFIPAWSRGAND